MPGRVGHGARILLALFLPSCARVELAGTAPETHRPTVEVALVVGVASLTIGGGAALTVREPDGQVVARIPTGETLRVTTSAGRVRFGSQGVGELPTIVAEDSGARVRFEGREYRGVVTLLPSARGLTAVNRVDLEEYLAGVVNAEMGRRGTAEEEALLAQAVVSRTVAMRALGRGRIRGYDVVASVSDQVYGGVATETEAGWRAVRATTGEVLTWNGVPIDAFFGSTCAGRTSDGGEVFVGAADHVYLRSVADLDPSGTPWCAISPRFVWREEWTGAELAAVLRETLPPTGTRAPTGAPEDVSIAERSPSGRVASLRIVYRGATIPVQGPAVRQVLRPAGLALLRSARFDLHVSRDRGGITRVVVNGGGAGHGVGMCQWGAVGRARAGFNYRKILAAYFPGTELQRLY